MIIGKHLIAGQWRDGTEQFSSRLLNGQLNNFENCTQQLVNEAARAAEQAFQSYAQTTSQQRADFLRTIASEINKRGDQITHIGHQETGLPVARLIGERARTTAQLEMFATHLEKKEYLDIHHDQALPNREPLARPDLKRMMRPFGPVAVFGASNFPLAFSTAGGDTASALAAACPVIVKAHPSHPATSDLVAQAILAAIEKCKIDPGVFSLLQDSSYDTAQQLVQHPAITAVGFTGSEAGGRYLFDLCVQRPTPIPFYGEMGSINPVFVLDHALSQSTENLATGWAASLTLGVGQFCTNPSVLIVPKGDIGDRLSQLIVEKLSEVEPEIMLSDSIANSYQTAAKKLAASNDTQVLYEDPCHNRQGAPYLFTTSAKNWLNNSDLQHEVFGPAGIIVRTESFDEMLAIAHSIQGQLTATLHIEKEDYPQAKALLDILEHKAGRILSNGFPTGVEVCDSMVHGGPYPAATFKGTTSVGSYAIQRFLRPVCYQNIPTELLPIELQL
ncbi:MAG: aldehyde dehydrogenase (NADP(+)) [Kangiellaceae bacterium]|nr:aldehyde dehydrogenase (NADP(+)) [Kangiellaceae bacterium]